MFNRFKGFSLAVLVCVATVMISSAQTFTTLANFDGGNGQSPFLATLVQGLDGNLYGTTEFGATSGTGTIFRITPAGTLTTIHIFPTDGGLPDAGLALANNGQFYGTAQHVSKGTGAVFRITPSGALTNLHTFHGTDGSGPNGLVQATNGDFYGTTAGGGSSSACSGGCGTVFKITPAGTFTALYSFDSTDGADSLAGLVQATDGDLFGTTYSGGSSNAGTVFKVTPGGALATLHTFDSTDGAHPLGLIQATNGKLYGTTETGGANNYGTVFVMTPEGALTTLHSFDSTDGALPDAGLVQGTDGSFYGTTITGGAYNYGTVFVMTPEGTLTTLHSFDLSDGSSPATGLVQGTDGSFYGTTNSGGTAGDGTVFKLSVGLGPFVKTLPTSGIVGAAIKILGTDLTGTTSVIFNGTAAQFSVVSATEITTAVPTGATTGKVQVTTPGGTLLSNMAFRVP